VSKAAHPDRYHALLSSHRVPVPVGQHYDEEHRKFVADSAVPRRFEGRMIVNRVIHAQDRVVSIKVEVWRATTVAPDTTRRHVVSATGEVHQLDGTYVLNTTEGVMRSVSPYLRWSLGGVVLQPKPWSLLVGTPVWVRNVSDGVPYLDIHADNAETTSLTHASYSAVSVTRRGAAGRTRFGAQTLYDILDNSEERSSGCSAFSIVDSSIKGVAAPFARGSKRNLADEDPIVYSPYLPVGVNGAATALTEWLVSPTPYYDLNGALVVNLV